MVPVSGLEPLLPKKPDFESSVSTNSTTLALQILEVCFTNLQEARIIAIEVLLASILLSITTVCRLFNRLAANNSFSHT
jgi:hypothetical protein